MGEQITGFDTIKVLGSCFLSVILCGTISQLPIGGKAKVILGAIALISPPAIVLARIEKKNNKK